MALDIEGTPPLDTAQQRLDWIVSIREALTGDDFTDLVDTVATTTAALIALTYVLEREIAEMAGFPTAQQCTCGYGGQHEDANPNCEWNRSGRWSR